MSLNANKAAVILSGSEESLNGIDSDIVKAGDYSLALSMAEAMFELESHCACPNTGGSVSVLPAEGWKNLLQD